MAEDASITSQTGTDNLHLKLAYLENRVAFTLLFFPAEAKLAMDIADTETASEFETPIMQSKSLRSRIEALTKTVDLGRHYFPHCSEVLDKFIDVDLPDFFYLETATHDEQQIKRMYFMELKEEVHKAFDEDKAEWSLSGLSSSSSSSSKKPV